MRSRASLSCRVPSRAFLASASAMTTRPSRVFRTFSPRRSALATRGRSTAGSATTSCSTDVREHGGSMTVNGARGRAQIRFLALGGLASELAADAYPCIMVWVFGPPHTRMWHDASCTNPQLPSDVVIADMLKCAVVLEALKDEPSVGANAPILDRFCARRLHAIVWVGARKRADRSNKETGG